MQVETLSEFEAIRRCFLGATTVRDDVALGIGDDAALLQVARDQRAVAAHAVSTDFELVESPREARRRGAGTVGVALNRLAAYGARPAWLTLALTLTEARRRWLDAFVEGLRECADRYGVALVGGDTTAGPAMISVWALGTVPRDAPNDGVPLPGDALLWITARASGTCASAPPCVAEGRALRGLANSMCAGEGTLDEALARFRGTYPGLTLDALREPRASGPPTLALCASVSRSRLAAVEAALRPFGASC